MSTTPQQLIDTINEIKKKSEPLLPLIKKVDSQETAFEIVVDQGPLFDMKLIYFDMYKTADAFVKKAVLDVPKVPAGAQADAVFKAYSELVAVHQQVQEYMIPVSHYFVNKFQPDEMVVVTDDMTNMFKAFNDILSLGMTSHQEKIHEISIAIHGSFNRARNGFMGNAKFEVPIPEGFRSRME